MTSTLYIFSYFPSIFFDQNQWEYDDSTDHVSSRIKIKITIFIIFFLHDVNRIGFFLISHIR